MKRKVSLFLVLVAVILVMCSCGGNGLVGKWEDDSDVIQFKSNGKYISQVYFGFGEESEYSINGDKLTLIEPLVGKEEYTYEIEGEKLLLKRNGKTVYTFKKSK